MAVVRRGERLYQYTSRVVRGKFVKEYGGRLSEEEAEAERAAVEERKAARRAERVRVAATAAEARAVLTDLGRCERAFHAAVFALGFRRHQRGQWRRVRGETPVNALTAIMEAFGPRKPAESLIDFRAPTPEDQKILDAAARGDASVLPKVREWLADPKNADWLGNVAMMAETALVHRVSGDNVAVREATRQKLAEQVKALREETPNPSLPVRLAAARVAHAWLATHTLETMSCRHQPGTQQALLVERQLASAERRLAVALRSLAALRRLTRGTAADAARDAMQLAFLKKIGKAPPVAAAGDSDGIR